jgi:predicted dehydrogenase
VDYRMNAGYIPPNHWVQGPEGGGRNIGEACHIYDLFGFLTDAEVASIQAQAIRSPSHEWLPTDNFVATLAYRDGSVCSLTYTALGHRRHPKEHVDAFFDGEVVSIEDYKMLQKASRRTPLWRSRVPQKGHLQEFEVLAAALREGGPWPIRLDEQLIAMDAALQVQKQISPTSSL